MESGSGSGRFGSCGGGVAVASQLVSATDAHGTVHARASARVSVCVCVSPKGWVCDKRVPCDMRRNAMHGTGRHASDRRCDDCNVPPGVAPGMQHAACTIPRRRPQRVIRHDRTGWIASAIRPVHTLTARCGTVSCRAIACWTPSGCLEPVRYVLCSVSTSRAYACSICSISACSFFA